MAIDIILDFKHKQSAHCENGATSNLLNFHGLSLSEPMVFGIGSGLFFNHIPFVKLDGVPLTFFRTLPGQIFKRLTKRLGIKQQTKTFRNERQAMEELDKVLAKGLPVGLLTSYFHLTYLPEAQRIPLNIHHIVVFGKRNGQYLISDSLLDQPTEISYDDLVRARFAKGVSPIKGLMYYPTEVSKNIDLKKPIKQGILNTAKDMLYVPLPFYGLWGIKYFSKKVKKYPSKLGDQKAKQYLENHIQIQEKIGTGGAAFRHLFAGFLQEATSILENDDFLQISEQMTKTAEHWTVFSDIAAKICNGSNSETENYNRLAEILLECREKERKIFKALISSF